jgi:hypothetical protein
MDLEASSLGFLNPLSEIVLHSKLVELALLYHL